MKKTSLMFILGLFALQYIAAKAPSTDNPPEYGSKSTTSNAQVQFGVKGGVNVSSLSFSNDNGDVEVLSRPGFFIGPTVSVSLPLGGLAIVGGLTYEQRNARHKSRDLIPHGEHPTTVKHEQIAIPLHLRYDQPLNDTWGLFAYAGPQVGFSVGKDIKLDYGEWQPKSTLININAGVGIILKEHLQVTAGYSWCSSQAAEIWLDRRTMVEEVRINSWQFSAAYLF